MSWHGILGHDDVVQQFRRSLARGRLASTFLFVGPEGIGKRTFAAKLAQTLLCQIHPAERMSPCEECPSCRQVLAGTHPDLHQVRKPEGKSEIPLELFIGDRDHRMEAGLCHDIALKPFMGGRRIAIIDDADDLNDEGANCLLKTLEEPPPRSVMILIGTSAEQQLPTIRSRSQIIRFQPLSEEILAQLLVSLEFVESPEEARQLARYSEGGLGRARELADAPLWAFRRELLAQLAATRWDGVRLGRAVCAFVDEAGKEASRRRARARQLITFAAEFYRHLARGLSGAPLDADADLSGAVQQALRSWPRDQEAAADCVTRCLEALQHIDRNANQSTLLEAWIDDLGQLLSGKYLTPVARIW
jgi:DNA polymerase-3 subunit delta'